MQIFFLTISPTVMLDASTSSFAHPASALFCTSSSVRPIRQSGLVRTILPRSVSCFPPFPFGISCFFFISIFFLRKASICCLNPVISISADKLSWCQGGRTRHQESLSAPAAFLMTCKNPDLVIFSNIFLKSELII